MPRASLVVVAAILAHFDLPEAGLLPILGVDQFLDMGPSATNAVAAAAVAQWEGDLRQQDASLEDIDVESPGENGFQQDGAGPALGQPHPN